jgi:hypothetical protein
MRRSIMKKYLSAKFSTSFPALLLPLSVTCSLLLALGGCTLPGLEYAEGIARAVVTDVELFPYVTAPIGGGRPVRSFVAAGYTGIVGWKVLESEEDTEGKPLPENAFVGGTLYMAEVTLYAASDFTLEGATFTHSKGTIKAAGTVEGNILTGMQILLLAAPGASGETPSSPIYWGAELVDLTHIIPAPENGATPVFSVQTAEFTGWVVWHKDDATNDEPYSALFEKTEEGGYWAEVYLTAAPGYNFYEEGGNKLADFTHDGGNVISSKPSDEGRIILSITFPKL